MNWKKKLGELEAQAMSVVIVGHKPHEGCKGEVLGILAVADTVRANAAEAIKALHAAGVEKVVMLSGDNQRTVDAISKQVGIDEAKGDLVPDQKIERVRELLAQHKHVGMIGDGVNDAPAMAAASIGIAMGGAGTDTAIETADIALMQDDLSKVAEVIRLGRRTVRIIKTNLSNLAGVPSIVYGILGYTVFRSTAHVLKVWFDGQHVFNVMGLFRVRLSRLPIYEDNVLVGALTLTLVILPTVITASQEALRSVPGSIRIASLALGATRWQTIWRQVIPAALPGISTGVILATSRAIGEAAPLIMLGALTITSMCPGSIDSPVKLLTRPMQVLHAPLDQFTAMPIEIYDWSKQPDPRFTAVAATGIVVLLFMLLTINAAAMIVRHYANRRLKW